MSTQPPSLSADAKATFQYLKYLDLKKADAPEKALQALQNATRLSPSPELYLEQGRFHWQRGQKDKALKAAKSGLQKFPGQGDLVRYLARLFIEQDKLDNATSLLSVYLRKHGGDPATVAELAKVYLQQENYGKARRLLQSVPQDKRSPQIHFLLGKIYLEKEEASQAISHLRNAVELNPDYLQAWARLGYAYEESKNYSEAKQAYSVLLNERRASDELLLKLIDLNLKLNNPDQAMDYVRRKSSGPDFLFQACSLLIQSNFFERAGQVLDMLPESARKTSRNFYYRAIISLRRDEEPRKALEYLNRITPSSELHQNAQLLKARIMFRHQEVEKALKSARKGRKDYPGVEAFWVLESRLLLEQDKPRMAKKILRKGLERDSNRTDLLFQLALVEHELGNFQTAIGKMRRLLQQEPENASALNFIGYTLVEQEQDLDEAGRLIRQALKLDPENPYYLDSLAWYLFKTDSRQKAWETIQKAISQIEDDPTIWEHYADIANSLEKKKKARKGYQRALELDPENPESLRKKLQGLMEK